MGYFQVPKVRSKIFKFFTALLSSLHYATQILKYKYLKNIFVQKDYFFSFLKNINQTNTLVLYANKINIAK
ncbi:unknown [[Mannheimia] succiniciproducens MBEL55E]|uniref:Uncharacterized protein n=1 Tax=Mannheimia succiniciproducens (strain KCTC 0769BP / MBEL55E) TaxID=221988 RepID=Q65T97_MANSM|nr:unknown [[Mannheimia] succiniciproducens MBEL55E]